MFKRHHKKCLKDITGSADLLGKFLSTECTECILSTCFKTECNFSVSLLTAFSRGFFFLQSVQPFATFSTMSAVNESVIYC